MSDQPLGIPNPATSDEVVEGRPWWKVCCMGCCLGIVVLLVLIWGGVRYFTGPGPHTVQRIPDSFPSNLPLYRPEEASEIVYYPGTSKGAMSKMITGPLQWLTGASSNLPDSAQGVNSSVEAVNRAMTNRFKQLEGRDTVAIRWDDLNATRDEVLRFYAGALKQAGVASPRMRRDDPSNTDEMVGTTDAISFSLLLIDDPAKPGVDHVSIVVEYPHTQ